MNYEYVIRFHPFYINFVDGGDPELELNILSSLKIDKPRSSTFYLICVSRLTTISTYGKNFVVAFWGEVAEGESVDPVSSSVGDRSFRRPVIIKEDHFYLSHLLERYIYKPSKSTAYHFWRRWTNKFFAGCAVSTERRIYAVNTLSRMVRHP